MANTRAFHGNKMDYVDFHHLTDIPLSIKKWSHKKFSLATIETNLHEKLACRCTTDKHLYNQILRMFKNQYRRSGKDDSMVTGVDKEDFFQILTILGLFATKPQSDALFEKYDTNNSNNISIHEFWVQCRPSDFRTLPGFTDTKKHLEDQDRASHRGKRMYIKESLLHEPVKPQSPSSRVYSLPLTKLIVGIKDKIRQNSLVDKTLSSQRTRRYLIKLFEYHDEGGMGYVDEKGLAKVFDYINYAVGAHYLGVFVANFPGPHPNTCDYQKLAYCVYPVEAKPPLTSCYIRNDAGLNMVSRLEKEVTLANSQLLDRRPSHSQQSQSQSRGSFTSRSRPASGSGYAASQHVRSRPPTGGSQTSRRATPTPRPPSNRRVRTPCAPRTSRPGSSQNFMAAAQRAM